MPHPGPGPGATDEPSLLSTPVMKAALSFGCALLLGLPVSARSQTSAPGLDPRKPITQYVHDVWQIDQGLPQNSVFAMAQTRDGYLWVGTEAGLARFDGVAFTTHNTSNAGTDGGLQGNFMATETVDAALSVEMAARNGDLILADSLVETLTRSVERLLDELGELSAPR